MTRVRFRSLDFAVLNEDPFAEGWAKRLVPLSAAHYVASRANCETSVSANCCSSVC